MRPGRSEAKRAGAGEPFAGVLPGFERRPEGERPSGRRLQRAGPGTPRPGDPERPAAAGRASSAAPLRVRPLAEYRPLFPRTLLNENPNKSLPFFWTINPYRGCEFGCTYCFARYTHGFMDLPPQDFERKIYVKIGAGDVLRETLRPDTLRGKPVAMGTATDPYQPAERHFGITRQILEVLAPCPDLELSITTKSPLVLRDLDLLQEIGRRHPLRVNVSMVTDDHDLARILENHAPSPRRRLETLGRLAQAGIATSVFVMPILPGITDDPERLLRLLRRAREAGAEEASGGLLHLEAAARQVFWPVLRRRFPDLYLRYGRIFGQGRLAPRELRRESAVLFSELRRKAGFREPAAPVVYEPAVGRQLELGV